MYSGTYNLILSTTEMIFGVCTVQIHRKKDFFGEDTGRQKGHFIMEHLEKRIPRR